MTISSRIQAKPSSLSELACRPSTFEQARIRVAERENAPAITVLFALKNVRPQSQRDERRLHLDLGELVARRGICFSPEATKSIILGAR